MSRGPPPCQRPGCGDPAKPPEYDLCEDHREEATYPASHPGPEPHIDPNTAPDGTALTDGGEHDGE